MPWRETCAMRERLKFVALFEAGEETVAELCRRFGISRKTGYKFMERFAACRPVRAIACAASASARSVRGDRAARCGAAGRASVLGPAQAAGAVADARWGGGLAGREHDRRDPAAPSIDHPAENARAGS